MNLKRGLKLSSFKEKPDSKTAQSYLENGGYLWNSGMFLFRASRYLDELKVFRPEMFEVCSKAMATAGQDLDFCRIPKETFTACPDESIDYAVFENTADAVVVPMDAGWNDIGSWTSLWDVSEKDGDGNACLGDVVVENTSNAFIRSDVS